MGVLFGREINIEEPSGEARAGVLGLSITVLNCCLMLPASPEIVSNPSKVKSQAPHSLFEVTRFVWPSRRPQGVMRAEDPQGCRSKVGV